MIQFSCKTAGKDTSPREVTVEPMKNSNTRMRLRSLMEERGLRQTDILRAAEPFCAKFSVKLNKSDLSQYLSGKSEPGQDKLAVLSMALDVSEGWLMGYDVPAERLPSPDARRGIRIPVFGNVAAGIPIEAITNFDAENPDDWEEIDAATAAAGNYFALRIKGDSMSPAICDGDIVIVRQQEDVESGETAIVMVNGEDATCKRIVKQSQGISLVANNPAYLPRFFTNREVIDVPVRVIGKVVELRRSF